MRIVWRPEVTARRSRAAVPKLILRDRIAIAWDSFTFTTLPNTLPVVTASNQTLHPNEWHQVRDWFATTDAAQRLWASISLDAAYKGRGPRRSTLAEPAISSSGSHVRQAAGLPINFEEKPRQRIAVLAGVLQLGRRGFRHIVSALGSRVRVAHQVRRSSAPPRVCGHTMMSQSAPGLPPTATCDSKAVPFMSHTSAWPLSFCHRMSLRLSPLN
jgi:hypothetical protein